MERVIELLNEKNHYLEKFYSLNETEIENFSVGNFDNLDGFYTTRERILEILKYLDSEILKEQADYSPEAIASSEHRKEIVQALNTKDEYVSRIIEQDIEVLTCIEQAKNNIIRELQDVRKNKKAIGSYKSKTFDNRLNEEV